MVHSMHLLTPHKESLINLVDLSAKDEQTFPGSLEDACRTSGSNHTLKKCNMFLFSKEIHV